MSDDDTPIVVNTPDGPIDPLDYGTLPAFKSAVYEYGVGTWEDDARLKILYEYAHDMEDDEA